jgi:hypothetical protein
MIRCIALLFLVAVSFAVYAESVFIEDMTWPEIADALQKGKTTATAAALARSTCPTRCAVRPLKAVYRLQTRRPGIDNCSHS